MTPSTYRIWNVAWAEAWAAKPARIAINADFILILIYAMIVNQRVLAFEDRQGLGLKGVFRLSEELTRCIRGCSTVIYTSFGGPGAGSPSHLGRLIPCLFHHSSVLARSLGGDMGVRGRTRLGSPWSSRLVLTGMWVLYTVQIEAGT